MDHSMSFNVSMYDSMSFNVYVDHSMSFNVAVDHTMSFNLFWVELFISLSLFCVLCPMMPVSLDFLFFISPSVHLSSCFTSFEY
jgi:hypothetical protein